MILSYRQTVCLCVCVSVYKLSRTKSERFIFWIRQQRHRLASKMIAVNLLRINMAPSSMLQY